MHENNTYNSLLQTLTAQGVDEYVIQPLTRKELSNLYKVTRRTFNSWLRPFAGEIGKVHGNYFNVKQVLIIYEKLGAPVEMIKLRKA